MDVWCILEIESFDCTNLVGACSTEGKANLAVEGMKRYSCAPEYKVIKIKVDAILDYVKECVDEELRAYNEIEAFLKRMEELEESE